MAALRTISVFLVATMFTFFAHAELRAFRLTITDSKTGSERHVVTRFDHVQYPMYRFVKQTEVVTISQTWMCYDRSDFMSSLCTPPESPATDLSGGPGMQDRRPATAAPPAR